MSTASVSPTKSPRKLPEKRPKASMLRRLASAFAYPQSAGKYLRLFAKTRAPEGEPARIVDIVAETPTCKSLVLKPRVPMTFQAGQFLMVTLNIDGVWQQRCYSISSAEGDDTITISVQAQTNGRASDYLHSLRKGDVLHISQAMGEFVAPTDNVQPLLLLTGGSGITPIMSMLRSGLLQQSRPVTHIHYAPDNNHTIFARELQALASQHSHYQLTVEHTREGGAHYSGEQLGRHCADWRERHTLLCGPASLMQSVQADWQAEHIEAQLSHEAFGPINNPVTADDHGAVHFTASGKTLTADEVSAAVHADSATDSEQVPTILDTAEATGLAPKFGCRVGICHSCDCHLLNGTVRNTRTGELIQTSADRGPVFIQPCISTAVGDVEVEL